MHYLFVPLLLAALGLPLSVIANLNPKLCNSKNNPVVAMAYYQNWGTAPSVPYQKLDIITYAFALVSFHFPIASLLI